MSPSRRKNSFGVVGLGVAAFPDSRQELVELVAEGDTVVARFRATGPASGRASVRAAGP